MDDLTCATTINGLPSKPDQWLSFLMELLYSDQVLTKKKTLKYFYARAKKVLDVEQNKNSESFARILTHEALHIGEESESDAREAFELASLKLRRVPFIHLSFAQFELNHGRRKKAQKILQLGLNYVPNDETLASALKKLQSGNDKIMPATQSHSIPSSSLTSSSTIDPHTHPTSDKTQARTVIRTPLRNASVVSRHTMAESLDLPCSPCTPELDSKTKPGVKGSQHRLSLSATKSISCHIPFNSEASQQSTAKSNKDSTKSSYDFGRPQRILKSRQRNFDDDAEDVYEHKMAATAKTMSSPFFKENQLPGLKWEKTGEPMPPPISLPPRLPQHRNSEQDVHDWPCKVLTVNNKNYYMMKELGVGGSSKVYEVFDSSNRSTKAVKQVTLEGCDSSVREGFINEIKFLQRLQGNQNIVHLYDHELTDSHLFMVMECGSTDLAKLMHQHKTQKVKLQPYEIWYFWKKMLTAVKTIHDHGVIHLDLKPANFLLVKGNLKLIDFGIANSIQADATSVIKDTQFGTLNYMAPEAIMDTSGGYHSNSPKFKISPRADVWSLGCILYFMMYSRTPFQHITHQIMKLNAIVNPACRIEFEDFPDIQLLEIVKKCLERDPKKRPTVEQLLHC